MGEKEFGAEWAEGAEMSTEEAIAYAQRGRGQRERPNSGWASLTPAELDIVRLVRERRGNKASPHGSLSTHVPPRPTSPTSTPNSG
jgi:hypothetical protein